MRTARQASLINDPWRAGATVGNSSNHHMYWAHRNTVGRQTIKGDGMFHCDHESISLRRAQCNLCFYWKKQTIIPRHSMYAIFTYIGVVETGSMYVNLPVPDTSCLGDLRFLVQR